MFKRLTYRNPGEFGLERISANHFIRWDADTKYESITGLAPERLAAYEDTGLTPYEIAALKADRDAWRRRAEAAEADLALTACCRTCKSWHKNGGSCAPIYPAGPMDCIVNEDNYEWEWRGPEEDKQ